MKNKGALIVVVLTVVLAGIILLAENPNIGNVISSKSVSGSVISGNVVSGNAILDLFKPKQGVTATSSGMTLKILNLPNKIEVGEDFVVKMSLTPGTLLGSPVLAVVADGLEIKDAPYGQFEEGGDTVLWYFMPDYSNINFTVSAVGAGDYNIQVRFAKFKPAGDGTLSTTLSVGDAGGDFGACEFADDFSSLNAKYYGNKTALVLSNSKLSMGAGYVARNKLYARETGLTYQIKITPGKGKTYVGFMNNDATAVAASAFVHSFFFRGIVSKQYTLSVYEPLGKITTGAFVYDPAKEYELKVKLKTNGADYYVREAGTSSWTLLYSGSSSYNKNNLVSAVASADANVRLVDDWVIGDEGCVG